ncbi:UNVERIFIED_CONTAM: ELMO domain-containing protein A [Sesamum latifolium]|uniref:ELMO domain-containing protein A n=1 Tax=Sesamum latifolium TaxID=2727402 RepID=A0AAW2XHP5_9LAMI
MFGPGRRPSVEVGIPSSMTSRARRKRLHHGDVDGGRYGRFETAEFDSLNEPLLGNRDYDDNKQSEEQSLTGILEDERREERLHWTLLFSHVILQWAQWLANIVLGCGSVIGRILPFTSGTQNGVKGSVPTVLLSSLQEARLRHLKQRLAIPFDGTFLEHQDALRQLWRLAYPDRQLPSLKSEVWKEMGWQGCDPSTDFRGGGFISLENLIFFAKTYPDAFQNLLHKRDGVRSEWEYPFAVAGINVSFMLVQMLDLHSGMPSTMAGRHFLKLLNDDETAFDNLFCVAFKMLDVQWLAKHASYMEFNEVLKSTRSQLERELALEDVSSVRDLPAYNLLKR